MALSANALHNVQRYGLEADMVQKQENALIVPGQFYVGTDSGKLRLGLSNLDYFEFAKAGDIPNVLVDDTASVDLSKANDGTITASVKRSAQAGNAIQELTDGLFVEVPTDFVTSVDDTATVDMTNASGVLSASVKRSAQAGNAIQELTDGLFVEVPADFVTSVDDTATVDMTNASGVLSAAVKISADANNTISAKADGIYAENFLKDIQDTDTIDLTTTVDDKLEARIIFNSNPKNMARATGGGLMVDALIYTKSNTDTINLDIDVDGDLSADLRIDPATDNLITSSASGVHAKKYTIHPDSSGLASINSLNQIKIEKLLIGEIYEYSAANATIAEYVASAQKTTDNPQTNDKIVLHNAASGGQEIWLCKSASPASASDFLLLEDPDVTDTHIRTRFSASNGAQYNSSTGNITANPSTDAGNDLTLASDDKLFLDASEAPVSRTSNSTTLSIEAFLNALDTQSVYTATNAITKTGNQFKLGGSLTEDTTIDGAFDLTIQNTKFDGTNIDVLTGDIKFNASTQGLLMKDPDGAYWKMTVNIAGQWVGTPFI